MKRLCVALVALILAAATIAPAFAQVQSFGVNEGIWHEEDRCAALAVQLFPDYTPKGNAARENYRRACLRAQNLPAPNGQASVPSSSAK
jgi:hypothetical protein